MTGAPSSTWFTAPPHWDWLIILYFFLGGLAGGCYFLSAAIDLFGRRRDRPLARLGYYVAFPAVAVSGLLLTIDLSRPDRFWHMFVERNTLGAMFKAWSPMSVGAWALLVFGGFTFVSFVGALAEDDAIAWPLLRRMQPAARHLRRLTRPVTAPAIVGRLVPVVGGAFGVFIAGYTGVLLAVTNRPLWSDTPLLGMLFIVSAASTSLAAILLLAHRAGWQTPGMADLHRLDIWVIALEFVVLIAFLVSLGPVLQASMIAWGVLLLVGVVLVGMVVPAAMWWRPGWLGRRDVTAPAALVLIGGFLLRAIVVLAGESV